MRSAARCHKPFISSPPDPNRTTNQSSGTNAPASKRRELRTVLSTPVDKRYFLRYNQQFDGTTRRTINLSGLRSVLLCLEFSLRIRAIYTRFKGIAHAPRKEPVSGNWFLQVRSVRPSERDKLISR